MIVYRLTCALGHGFEGWFSCAEECDRQFADGSVRCPMCDSQEISRLPSAPYVNTGAVQAKTPVRRGVPEAESAARALGEAMAAVKAYIREHTEDVGRRFPEVARRMHYGEEDHRGIRGRVTPAEAQSLQEEGVPAVALPAALAIGEDVH